MTIFCLSSLLSLLRIACLAHTKEVLTEHCGMNGCVYNTSNKYEAYTCVRISILLRPTLCVVTVPPEPVTHLAKIREAG